MNERAKRTRAALDEALGGARRKARPLPVQRWPKGLQRNYVRTLLRKTSAIKQSLEPLIDALPSLVSGAADRNRLDSIESDRLRALIRQAEDRLAAGFEFNARNLEAMAATFAGGLEAWQEREFRKQVLAHFGVDVMAGDARLQGARDAFMQENVSLIKGLPGRTYAEIEAMTIREIEAGALHGDLAKKLRERFGFADKRAKLIARDQTGKYYGNVNRVRQQNMGVTHYIWRDSSDERVRDTHSQYSGQKWRWGEAPEGDPGQPIQCRCYPEPIFTGISL